jgi:uncharacterized cupin superfamily protein
VGRPKATAVNLFNLEFEYDDSDPDGYRCGAVRLASALAAKEINVNVFEMPAGQNLCPYHYEYIEEWLIVLEGAVRLRAPDGERDLERGDVVCFPAGPAGAHKLINDGSDTARVMMFSSSREPAVAVYPDSDKIGVWPGGADEDNIMVRRSEAHLSYYEGE